MGAIVRGPKSHLLLVLLVGGPALALGGTAPWIVPPFAALVAVLVGSNLRGRKTLEVPWVAVLGAIAAGFTLLQVLPVPGLRGALAPVLDEWITHATGEGDATWPGLSPSPADTSMEVVRLLALTGLTLAAAQCSWRVSAAAVALTGALVAIVGLVQYGLGIDQIYGLYEAKHGARELSPALLSTFVSPNHQSGLLLLGLLATAGLWVDGRGVRYESQRLDRRVALGAALVVQLAALVLSMSRGALLVAVFITPAAVLVAWWPERTGHAWRLRRMAPRLAAVMTLAGIVIGLGTLGAWSELQTLLVADGIDPSTAARLRVTLGSVDLIELAPLTGIGRGAYGDVFTAFDPMPNHVWYSHLECAPLTFVVEWGLVVGGALALALPAWWLGAMRRSGEHDDARARRMVLLGLLAVALQGLADFSLEFVGVAAPAAALAGSLSPVARRGLGVRAARWGAVALVGMAVASVPLVPSTWVHRGEATRAEAAHPIATRPLDASRHRYLARASAARGEWSEALVRARIAVRLEPGHVDGWLLVAAAAHAQGDRAAMEHATAQALERLHDPPDRALLEYWIAGFPEPERFASLAPDRVEAWDLLVRGLLDVSPAHADAMARVWAQRHPDEPEALRMQVEANLRLERPGLALHHARLWRALAPSDARAHLGVARALQISSTPRPADVREALHRALTEASIDDLHHRGLIEEQLLRSVLRMDGPAARLEAREIATALRTRPAPVDVRQRWRALFVPVLEGGVRAGRGG